MSIQKYQVFLHVMEAGSVSRAAEDMGLTQSAVSHALSSLEEDFGFKLLTRSRAGVRLSSEGKRILPAIRDILSAEERLRETVSSIHGLSTGTIRVASFSSVAVHWLPAMLKAFQEQYPQIRFKLLNGDYHDVEQWLEEGAVDLGFVSLPTRAPGKVTPLMEDRLLVILPKDHPLASLDSFPIGYARQHPLHHQGRLRHHRHGGAGAGHRHHAGAAASGPHRQHRRPGAEAPGPTHHRFSRDRTRAAEPCCPDVCRFRCSARSFQSFGRAVGFPHISKRMISSRVSPFTAT